MNNSVKINDQSMIIKVDNTQSPCIQPLPDLKIKIILICAQIYPFACYGVAPPPLKKLLNVLFLYDLTFIK